jgi:hypothetical protein
MLACGALLVVAAAAAWRWRACTLELPAWATSEDRGIGRSVRALVWLGGVAVLSGLLVGALVVGPAGRLVMRLLAATSPEAHGRLTEADQVIGTISLSGTIGFFVFVGLPFGLVVALAYALTSFALPRGIAGGALFGAVLLVLLSGVIDPLREENPDFDLVGPGWLAVLAFSAMALLTGVLTAPIAGRVAAALPPPSLWWLIWLLPFGLFLAGALIAFPASLAFVVVACGVFVAALLVPPGRRRTVWSRGRRALQAVLAAAVVVTAPGFLSAVSSIIEESPTL